MNDWDRYICVARVKAKIRYWCRSRGATKEAQDSLIALINNMPFIVCDKISPKEVSKKEEVNG